MWNRNYFKRMDKKTFYFPHDFNARNDEKIVAVRLKYGMEGYGVYFAILERLGESSDYIHVKDYNIISFDLRVGNSLVKSIIEDFGLFEFTEDGKHFYSVSFNERMKPLNDLREKRSNAGKAGMEKRWKLKQTDNSVITVLSKTDNKPVTKDCDFITEKIEESNKEKPPKGGKKKDAAIAATLVRDLEFYHSLIPFVGQYTREMIREFYDYWREKTKSGGRMRFELQPTWELPKRLATWAKRDKNFNRNKNEKEQPKTVIVVGP
jgi:hypothetical protein